MISDATRAFLVIGTVFSFALPVGALLYWRRTRRAKLAPFLVGALVFVVFARVLEPLAHYVFLYADNAASRAINANPYLYMLYGGLAAGVFEETGRYVAFRTLLSPRRFPERDTAVTYGIGHGGAESMLIQGGAFIAYLTLAAYLARGNEPAALALAGGSAEALRALRASFEALTPGAVLASMLERVAALLLHVGLSCFVFLAARDRTQRSWFPFAIVLHALVDMPAVLYRMGRLPLSVVELWIWVAALCVLYAGRKCYREAADP